MESNAQALVNPVNIVGVMGKGLALQFKKTFPLNYKLYKKACENKYIQIGRPFLTFDSGKIIINFPTKVDWKNPSKYDFIIKGLETLKKQIEIFDIKSIAIPALGVGNGGLEWPKVKQIIEDKLKDLTIDIYIYEPL